MIEHQITHYFQPTNYSCSQSALAMLLSFYSKKVSPEEILTSVPTITNDRGEDLGTINQMLATWCLKQGFDVEMYTAEFQIIDLSWAKLDEDKLLSHMIAAKGARDVPALGKVWSEVYLQSYINFVQDGGKLHIEPYMTSSLIDRLLANGPILACVCFNVLHTIGRTTEQGLRKFSIDDVDGRITNHTVVVYGKDNGGSYLMADPWQEPGRIVIEPEHLLAAMAASQIECDNLVFQIAQRA